MERISRYCLNPNLSLCSVTPIYSLKTLAKGQRAVVKTREEPASEAPARPFFSHLNLSRLVSQSHYHVLRAGQHYFTFKGSTYSFWSSCAESSRNAFTTALCPTPEHYFTICVTEKATDWLFLLRAWVFLFVAAKV